MTEASARSAAPESWPRLAVDIGGTKIEAAIVSSDGSITHRFRTATSPADPWSGVANSVRQTLNAASDNDIRALSCGVGCGGPMTAGGGMVSPFNLPGWKDFPLRNRLSDLTGLPTRVDNDANALAAAEGWLGAARGLTDYMAMVVSTGLGSAVMSAGQLLRGGSGNGGNIGHLVAVPGGRRCLCGARGCLEAECAGNAIRAATNRPPSEASATVVDRVGSLVGVTIAGAATLLDLRVAVIGGGVALGFGQPFFDAAQRACDAACHLPHLAGLTIVPAELGSDAPLIGAAANVAAPIS